MKLLIEIDLTDEVVQEICSGKGYSDTLVIISNPGEYPMQTSEVPNPETPEQFVQRYYNEMVTNDILIYTS